MTFFAREVGCCATVIALYCAPGPRVEKEMNKLLTTMHGSAHESCEATVLLAIRISTSRQQSLATLDVFTGRGAVQRANTAGIAGFCIDVGAAVDQQLHDFGMPEERSVV